MSFSGCYSCYPEEPEKCFVCNIGYYMNKEVRCLADGSTPGNQVQEEENLGRLRVVLSMLVALLYV